MFITRMWCLSCSPPWPWRQPLPRPWAWPSTVTGETLNPWCLHWAAELSREQRPPGFLSEIIKWEIEHLHPLGNFWSIIQLLAIKQSSRIRETTFQKTSRLPCSRSTVYTGRWQQPKCVGQQERSRSGVCRHQNSTQSEKIASFAETRVDLETVLQSEVKSEESKCHMLKYILK